jgi:group I intron endonuclease
MEEVKGYIYRHWIVNDNGVEKSYIGQTINNVNERWKNGRGYKNSTKFARAINKYGWNSFNHEIIGVVESTSKEQLILDLNEWETYYISKYDSFHNGYNSTTGGDSGMTMSEESNYKKSITKIGKLNPMYGKTHTEEARQRISDSSKGRKLDEETRQKISDSRKGIKFSDEHLANLSTSHIGNTHSEETKKKMSNSRKGNKHWRATKVVCLETGDVFNTVKEAQDFCGSQKVCECCKGKRNSAGTHPQTGVRLHWMYYEDYLKTIEKDDVK